MKRVLVLGVLVGVSLGLLGPALAQETLKIGAPQPMTGPDAPFGDKFKKVHKLHVQFCCDLKHAAKAQRAVRLDEEVKKLRLGIVGNTKERYVVQDRVFLDWKKRRMLLEFAFRGGEVLVGSIKYFGRFELLIDIGPPGEGLLCKHALNSIQPAAT